MRVAAIPRPGPAEAGPHTSRIYVPIFLNTCRISHLFGDAPFAVVATSTAGLPVAFAASGACTVTGATISLNAVGTCTVVASQPGDQHFNPAASVARSFPVFYAWSGVLEPLSAGGNVAKQSSTVPVKFRLTSASAAVTNLPARIFGAMVSAGGVVVLRK